MQEIKLKNPEFVGLLRKAKITQSELARILDLTPAAVSRWHKIGVPQYARAYLLLRAENLCLKHELARKAA